jgi:DNA-binding NarL/FixJ family response regulator
MVAATVGLSAREVQVVQLVARGLNNQQIADELHLSAPTVKTHLGRICRRHQLHTRTQIVMYGLESGVIQPVPDNTRTQAIASLSPRQYQVALYATKGYSNGEIAGQLKVNQEAVKTQLRCAFRLLGISHRCQLPLFFPPSAALASAS